MSSKVRKFLGDLGMNDNQATKMYMFLNSNEEEPLPDELNDFVYENSLDSFKNDFEEIAVLKRKDGLISEYEKESHTKKWAEFSNPILQFVKKEGQFTKEEIEGKQPKEAIQMLIDAKNKQVLLASDKMDESHLDKITSLQDNNQKLLDELDLIKSQAEQRITEAKAEATQEIYNFHARGYINKRMRSGVVAFDYDDKIDFYAKTFIPEIMGKYKIVNYDTGEIRMPDGTKAVAFDGNGFYKTVDQAIASLAKINKCVKLSNGDQSNLRASDRSHVQVQGKTVDVSGTNFLKQAMGS